MSKHVSFLEARMPKHMAPLQPTATTEFQGQLLLTSKYLRGTDSVPGITLIPKGKAGLDSPHSLSRHRAVTASAGRKAVGYREVELKYPRDIRH